MTTFTIVIDDPAKLAGIDAACAAYNAAQLASAPFKNDAEGNPTEEKDFTPKTAAQYVQFVMDSAAQSYANSYGV